MLLQKEMAPLSLANTEVSSTPTMTPSTVAVPWWKADQFSKTCASSLAVLPPVMTRALPRVAFSLCKPHAVTLAKIDTGFTSGPADRTSGLVQTKLKPSGTAGLKMGLSNSLCLFILGPGLVSCDSVLEECFAPAVGDWLHS